MNAGYTGYYDNHNGADDALTMTLFEITDTAVTVSRYAADGVHSLKSEGKPNGYHNEQGYAPDSDVQDSPLTIELTPVSDSSPMSPAPGLLTDFVMRIYELLKKLFSLFG